MKAVNRIRTAIFLSAAMSLAVLGSSASAQPGNHDYCNFVAWTNCSWQDGQRILPTTECVDAQYAACMSGYAASNVKALGNQDKRRVVKLASRFGTPTPMR